MNTVQRLMALAVIVSVFVAMVSVSAAAPKEVMASAYYGEVRFTPSC